MRYIAENFLKEKLGYTQQEIDAFNKYNSNQVLDLYKTIRGMTTIIKANSYRHNPDSFNL